MNEKAKVWQVFLLGVLGGVITRDNLLMIKSIKSTKVGPVLMVVDNEGDEMMIEIAVTSAEAD